MRLLPALVATDPVTQWFDQRGCTALLKGTDKHRDTSARALPALLGLFLFVMLILVPVSTPANRLGAFATSVGVLLATWLFGRLVRRGRPWWFFARVRWTEMAAFVLGPVIAVGLPRYRPASLPELPDVVLDPLIMKLLTMAAFAVLQVALLLTVLVVTGLGLVSLSVWLLREFSSSLRSTGSALAASLPVILGVVFFFFLNPGVWLVIGRLPGSAYTAAIGLLLLLTGAFLGSRSQFDLHTLARFDTAQDLQEALEETPMKGSRFVFSAPAQCPLSLRQAMNARMIAVLSRLVVAFVIGLAVFSFFVVLGYFTIDTEVISSWTKAQPKPVLDYAGARRTYLVAWEHLKVAGFLATFAMMNFSLASATDARLRLAANDNSTALVRQACAMRLALLLQGETWRAAGQR